MAECYPILLEGHEVGTARVERRGLYYHFSCTCRVDRDQMLSVRVLCGDRREDLGLLVPEGDAFTLKTRFSIKRLGEGNLQFIVVPRREEGVFHPLDPDAPFGHLSALRSSFLENRNGLLGIVITPDTPPAPQ